MKKNKTGDQVVEVNPFSTQKRRKYFRPPLSKESEAITLELFHKWNRILAKANKKIPRSSPVKRDVITGY